MPIKWSSELEIGISVIDSQHQRIVEYINQVEHVRKTHDKHELLLILDELVDYTLSHFAFEESLMEDAGYPFSKAHKKVHQLFTRRVESFLKRFNDGEDIADELLHVLKTWLINHIKRDDRDYSGSVKASMAAEARRTKVKKGSWFSRLFGG
ncbi:MAG: bacteriohemerythrin [Reinekea sp.]|jgi:hemerythrin